MQDLRIGFVGGGNMARSLIGGLLKSGADANRLLVSDPDPERRRGLADAFGVEVTADNAYIASGADAVVLAVKPQVMQSALQSMAPPIAERRPLLVSIAAGVRIASIAAWSSSEVPIVRVMPNTPALVGSGISALFANALASDADKDAAESILRAVGTTVWVAAETDLDAVTAVSGSGPAYFFYLMEALEAAAVRQGLDSTTARLLTLETALGAAKLALESDESPAHLRRRVTSPGGTTECALGVMEAAGMGRTMAAAVEAAAVRSAELADVLEQG